MGVFDFDQEDELSVDVNNGKENKDYRFGDSVRIIL